MSSPQPYGKGNISRGSRIPRTPVSQPQQQTQQQEPRTKILDQQVQKSGGRKRKSFVEERAEVLREEGDKTGGGGGIGDTFSISGPRPRSKAKRKSSALPATSFFDKDLDKMTDSQIENNYKRNELVSMQVRRLRSSVGSGGSARSSLASVSSKDSFKPSDSQIDAEMKKNAILVPGPPKSTDNSVMPSRGGTFTIDGTPISVSAFENAFKANANIIVPHYNHNSNDQSDSSNNSYVPSESKIIEAMKKHGPYVPPMKKSTKRSSSQSDISDRLTDSVYEREFRKNAILIAPGIKKSTHASETLSTSSGDHDQDVEEQIDISKKSDDRETETEQITFEVEKGTFTKETQPLNVEKDDNLEEENQNEDEISTIVETFEKDDVSISKKLQRTTRKSLWKESIEDSSEGLDSTNRLRASVSVSGENNANIEVSKKNDETIIIEQQQQQQQEKRDLVKVSKKKGETIIIEKEKEQQQQKQKQQQQKQKQQKQQQQQEKRDLVKVSKKKDETIIIEKEPEKRDLVKKVPIKPKAKPQSQSQQPEPRITRKNNNVDLVNNYNDEKTQKINHSTPIKKAATKKKNLNHLNLSAISSQANKDFNSLMSVKRPRLEKKQELLKLRKSSQTDRILKNVFEMSFSSENEESENEELTLKDDKKNNDKDDESETSFEDPDHLPSSCSINNDYDSDNKSIDEIEKEVERPKTPNKDLIDKIVKKSSKKAITDNSKKSKDNDNEKEVEKPKTPNKVKEKPSDLIEKNVKKSTMKETGRNIKKPKVILPKKVGKNQDIDKPTSTRTLRLRGQQPDKDKENPKSPLKVTTPSPSSSSSPQKKKLRTSSTSDVHKNDKSLALPIKKITRRSSIQPETSDRPRDPAGYEREIRKNDSIIAPEIKESTQDHYEEHHENVDDHEKSKTRDSNEKNVKKSSKKKEINIKKLKVILPKKLGKINKAATMDKLRSLRLRSNKDTDKDKEISKTPLKDQTSSSSPQKKKLRTSSTSDVNKNKNDKSLDIPIKKITRRSSIQPETSDQLRDPVYEKETRKNDSVIASEVKESNAPKTRSISSEDQEGQGDSNEKNVKKSSTKENNIKKAKAILPKKVGKINKATTDKLTMRSLTRLSIRNQAPDDKENSKTPLKDPTPSSSPQKKKLRTSSRSDVNKNDKSPDISIKKITRRSSIQPEASDQLRDPEYETRKNDSIIAPEIKESNTSKTRPISAEDQEEQGDSNEKNVKKSTKKEINIKKPKVILPKKVGNNKAIDKSTKSLRSLEPDKEISKTPLKDLTSSSPPKKKLRTSSRPDVNRNDKSLDISIKKITRKSSIQLETSDRLRDPVYEKGIRKNDSIIAPEIKKSKTLSILSEDYNYDQDEGKQIDSIPVSSTKKSDDREIEQISNSLAEKKVLKNYTTTPRQRSSIIGKSSVRNASLKISSKYKKKFELKNRSLSARLSSPEPGPSSRTLNLNAKRKVQVVKKKSEAKIKKVEYAKLYQLQNRLWGKMNPSDIKRVHRVMNNYIELFLNQIQSNCRNIYGKYTYLELERALAAEGLIPRKKGYLLSYMASIFNTEQMKLVMSNGLFPRHERNITGNNFPE